MNTTVTKVFIEHLGHSSVYTQQTYTNAHTGLVTHFHVFVVFVVTPALT